MINGLALLALASSNPIKLNVDATDAARGIFHVNEVLPATGPLVLKVPKWIPGEHGPSGKLFDIVNIHFKQGGRELKWQHDPLDLFSIHVDSEDGTVEAAFDYVAPRHDLASRNLARVKWNRLILVPNGKSSTTVAPKLTPPSGWKVATALDFDHSGNLETTTVERLIDSPAVIGANYSSFRIDSPGTPPASIEVFTEKPAEVPSEVVDFHKRLYREGIQFFGGPHFRHYQFLLTFSSQGGSEGLEHNESSEDGFDFEDLQNIVSIADLDAHEFAHSWCGKYRRPHGLSNLDVDAPMSDEDLWIYEGFTQFAGYVLSARAKGWTTEQWLDAIALKVDGLQHNTGRSWRTLEDTAKFGSLINVMPDAWYSRRRGPDYYDEMVPNWLEADSVIRRLSNGAKSIDSFALSFFGGKNNGPEIRPFKRNDLFVALSGVQTHDWQAFFEKRVFQIRPNLNDGWLEAMGWKLTYSTEPNKFLMDISGGERKASDTMNSLGLYVEDDEIRDVREGSVADRAKLAPGMKLISVNGTKYSPEAMDEALQAGMKESEPLRLIVDDYETIQTIAVDYHGGIRYAHLARMDGVPDLLSPIGERPNRP